MSAFGHEVWPMDEATKAYYREGLASEIERYGATSMYACAIPKCTEVPIYFAVYQYVTGRAGRVTWAQRKLCRTHAVRFIDRNEAVEHTEPRPRAHHASEIAFAQVSGSELTP